MDVAHPEEDIEDPRLIDLRFRTFEAADLQNFMFDGAHNRGNDTVTNLKAHLYMTMDLTFDTGS